MVRVEEGREFRFLGDLYSQESTFPLVYVIFWEQSGQADVENGAICWPHIQIYFRMHHFVVKFSEFTSPRAARGHWPPNQVPARTLLRVRLIGRALDRLQSPMSRQPLIRRRRRFVKPGLTLAAFSDGEMNEWQPRGRIKARKEGRRYIRIKVAVSPAEDLEVCIDRVRRIRRGLRENSRASLADLGFF